MNEQLSSREQEQQRDLVEGLLAPQPTVIGLEGGPCSGKTTLSAAIAAGAAEIGRPVVIVPEAASEHLARLSASGRTLGELAVHDRPAYVAFERDVLGTIIARLEQTRQAHVGTDAIVVADRVDIGAYVSHAEHRQLFTHFGLWRPPMYDLVDKVIFLPSVASERPDLYGDLRGTNKDRVEVSADVAAGVCAANLQAVRRHPELQVAWGGDFGNKIRRLAEAVLHPEVEGEVKLGVSPAEAKAFLDKAAQTGGLLNDMTIYQSYHQLGGQEFRLRESTSVEGTDRFFTVKTGQGALRRELQRTLNQEQLTLLGRAQRLGRTLVKQRFVVLDDSQPDGRRRLWYADNYRSPGIDEWHFETEVEDEAEAKQIAAQYPTRRRITESAKELIFK